MSQAKSPAASVNSNLFKKRKGMPIEEQKEKRVGRAPSKDSLFESEPTAHQESAKAKTQHRFGDKQLVDLLHAVEHESLYRTQGQHWKSQRVKQSAIGAFLSGKLQEQRGSATSHNTFAYLSAHIVGERPMPSELAQLSAILADKFQLCKIGNSHLQCKVPCSDISVSPSDLQKGKHIGLLQVQAYKLNEILRAGSDQPVAESIRGYLAQENKIAAHLCKQKCLTSGHVALLNAKINKQHDACPAWWIVQGKLVNFCSCASQERCLAPGPMFDATRFARALQVVMAGTQDPLLQLEQ